MWSSTSTAGVPRTDALTYTALSGHITHLWHPLCGTTAHCCIAWLYNLQEGLENKSSPFCMLLLCGMLCCIIAVSSSETAEMCSIHNGMSSDMTMIIMQLARRWLSMLHHLASHGLLQLLYISNGSSVLVGAETGTGGRIRDTHATGKGSIMGVSTAGYCVGNLRLENYNLPWEHEDFVYPENLASPTQILIDASNGASDYGNKFGEPMVAGYTRTFGTRLHDGSRREWIKPIMFRCVSLWLGYIKHM